jgi:hypothetical protein
MWDCRTELCREFFSRKTSLDRLCGPGRGSQEGRAWTGFAVPGEALKKDEPGPALRSRARLSRRTPNWFAQSSRLGEHVVSSETKRGDSLRESSFAV